jgi:hypothetical protein
MQALSLSVNRPAVIDGIFDDEVVIVNFDTGRYYHTDRIGSSIWNLIELGATSSEIIQHLKSVYRNAQAMVETSVRQFISELLLEGLVVAASHESSAANSDWRDSIPSITIDHAASFLIPRLVKYTDLEDLLGGPLRY